MDKAELDTFRKKLLALQDRLRGDVSHLTEEALPTEGGEGGGNLSRTPIHMADLGSDIRVERLSLEGLDLPAVTEMVN